MKTKGTILFRVGAGRRIGLGHLRRSISLALALGNQGVRSRFLVSGSREGLRYLARLGCEGRMVSPSAAWRSPDLRILRREAASDDVRGVVVDSCDVPVRYLEGLRRTGFSVAVRDDVGKVHLPVDLLFNGNADARRLLYESNGSGTRFLLGPEYAVLPSDFWRCSPRRIRRSVRRVLVLLGGEDPHRLMPRLLKELDTLPGNFAVTAVVGPFFRDRERLGRTVRSCRRKVRLLQSPRSLFSVMKQADLAISGAGQTLYELACVGCPTLAIQVAGDQAGQLKELSRVGFVRRIGPVGDERFWKRFREALVSLMNDSIRRASMARAGQRLVDGRGAVRVACALKDLFR